MRTVIKLLTALLVVSFGCGCARNKDYFEYNGKQGPYIPRYLHFHPEKKT